jgi:hypothetical protein
MASQPSSLAEAALATAALLREAAEISLAQADLMRRRAAAVRALAESERIEAGMTPSPVHAGPRHHHAVLLDQEAEVHEAEAEVLDREAKRMLSQAHTAELRAKALS